MRDLKVSLSWLASMANSPEREKCADTIHELALHNTERALEAEALARELAERLEDALSIIRHRREKQIAPDWEPTRVYRCRETLDKAKEVLDDDA